METTQDKLNSIGEMIGDEANRKLDELIAKGPQLAELGRNVMNAAKDCALITDKYVRENSWKAVGMAAALGLIVGVLLRRD